jgi:hypothetical protein
MDPSQWYSFAKDDLQQGDILEEFPVFSLSPESYNAGYSPTFDRHKENLIILSQSCDLAADHEKLQELLACPLWMRADLPRTHHLATDKGMEDARRGNLPGFHLLARCSLPGFDRDFRIVDFSQIYSIPIGYVRQHLSATFTARLRLVSPFRELLAQAFARFIMRVAVPDEAVIPSFSSKQKAGR